MIFHYCCAKLGAATGKIFIYWHRKTDSPDSSYFYRAMADVKTTSLFDIAAAFVLHTNRHVFLTGRAGTGKTTFLKQIIEQTSKNTVVVAPTGVAAINAGGVTIHSLFQLPLGSFIPTAQRGFSAAPSSGTDLPTLLRNIRMSKEKRRTLEELELLVIDEVSMLRADTLDAIDGVLRHFRKRLNEPFGGVQMLYIGDLHQLPPVVSDSEWSMMSAYYQSMFFFDAHVMTGAPMVHIELDKIYRQTDECFISILNNIRNNEATDEDLDLLNRHHDPHFYPEPDEGYIILTSHNYKAEKINQGALARLDNEPYSFQGTLSGDFNENALPVDQKLTLKEGAQVMFIRNDKGDQRRYYNGKIGVISRIKNDKIYVRFPQEREEMMLEQETWRNVRYQYDEVEDKIKEEELGAYRQYPVRLAWAVTIHKSQGLTFERAIIDAGQSFAPGQVYVALSRLTSLSGLVLASPITPAAIHTEDRIAAFTQRKDELEELLPELEQSQREYLQQQLLKSFNWDKMLEVFREHHSTYSSMKLPHQKDAVEWSATMILELVKMKEVSDKFLNELRRLLAEGTGDNYKGLHKRLAAAYNYYQNEIHQKLLTPWQKHFDETKPKAKTKKYLRSLQPLYTLIIRKKQQLEQAVIMAEGLASGKNLFHLLQQYQNTDKAVPSIPSIGDKAGGVKEDSKSISLQLLKQGKTLEQIAAERGLVRGTIEGHLLQFIPTGEVKMEQIVAPEKVPVIMQAIERSEQKGISNIRAVTGDACTYNEIKAVLLHLEKEEKH
jgi:hypothetical protein